jgi:hypothetical protein
LIVLMLTYLDNAAGKIVLPVVGVGLTGSIYVVCPAIIGEFAPVPARKRRRDLWRDPNSAGVLAPEGEPARAG